FQVRRPAHIRLAVHGAPAALADLPGDVLARLGREAVDHHRGPFPGEPLRAGPPDPRRGSRYQCYLVRESHAVPLSPDHGEHRDTESHTEKNMRSSSLSLSVKYSVSPCSPWLSPFYRNGASRSGISSSTIRSSDSHIRPPSQAAALAAS